MLGEKSVIMFTFGLPDWPLRSNVAPSMSITNDVKCGCSYEIFSFGRVHSDVRN